MTEHLLTASSRPKWRTPRSIHEPPPATAPHESTPVRLIVAAVLLLSCTPGRTSQLAAFPTEPRRRGSVPVRRSGRQPARIRFLGGGRARNTVVRSRATGKKARRDDGAADDGNLGFTGVDDGGGGAHAGFRGAGGHSAGGRSLLPSDVGVVGSASASCSWASEPASSPCCCGCRFSATGKATDSASGAGAVDDEAADEQAGSGAAAGAVVVLIGGSAGRTSAAVELIWPSVGAREITSGAAVGAREWEEVKRGRGGADNAKDARR